MHHLLYHAHCADGLASAIIALHALTRQGIPASRIRLQAVNYPDALQMPPEIKRGDHLFYLDYTPTESTLESIVNTESAIDLTIIDHHASAAPRHEKPWFESVFDLTQSGAGLTFKHFFTGNLLPRAIALIQHRDLGHAWQDPSHPYSNASLGLQAYLMRCIPRTIEAWSPILFSLSESLLANYIELGQRLRITDQVIIAAAVNAPYWLHMCHPASGLFSRVPACNGLDPGLTSDICQSLLKSYPDAPFAATWHIDASTGQAVYSLRSRKDGPNVAEIAAAMAPGGGGHPCAAGFSTPIPIPFAE